MHRQLYILQNTAAVLLLFGIISLSTLAVLGITPLSDAEVLALQTSSQRGDVSTSEVISNLKPIAVLDTYNYSEGSEYFSQLIKTNPKSYTHHIQLHPKSEGEYSYPFLKIENPNYNSIKVAIKAQIPQGINSNVIVSLRDRDGQYAFNWEGDLDREQVFTVPAKQTKEWEVVYNYNTDVAFPVELSFQVVISE